MRIFWKAIGFGIGFLAAPALLAGAPDVEFLQPQVSPIAQSPALRQARFLQAAVNKDGIVYVLTDRGLARLFDRLLAPDGTYRPLAGKTPLEIAVGRGELFYLFPDQWLSNGWAGKEQGDLPRGAFAHFCPGANGTVLLMGGGQAVLRAGGRTRAWACSCEIRGRICWAGGRYVWAAPAGIWTLTPGGPRLARRQAGAQTIAADGDRLWIGLTNGFFQIDPADGRVTVPLQTKLPCANVTALAPSPDGLWVGTTRGCFRWRPGRRCEYFASRRWLKDDGVIDLKWAGCRTLFALTRTGLNAIEFRPMTLAAKADCFERRIRQRHIRYGLCAEIYLPNPDDLASAQMIDTDNDGTWSSYYMASQAFRYAVTREASARRHAWETFAALERLESINGLRGFPSRSFERAGFKVSDPDRWHAAPDRRWEWKAHTSSDEFIAHTFGCAVLWETAAENSEEKDRIRRFYTKIIDHILEHGLRLIDVDGRPTLWGRWDPAYVNGYPHTIGDRRLNSAEIIAGLEFAQALTGDLKYRRKAEELLRKFGYLDNIVSSMRLIKATPGYFHEGIEMGDEWNHSDDLLALDADWTLYRYAFTPSLKAQFASAIRDHWEIEKIERAPLWSFLLASTGAADCDLSGALWTLRRFPLDLRAWSVRNSHRGDLTFLPPNFRHQQIQELLSPEERPLTRNTGNPFEIDGGNDGHTELAGDEFLLPYWMGRYLGLIDGPGKRGSRRRISDVNGRTSRLGPRTALTSQR